MWIIDKTFDDYTHPKKRVCVKLNPDSPLHPSAIRYPVTWFGDVCGHDVEIIQKGAASKYVEDFTFSIFPDKFSHVQQDIVAWIDEKSRWVV